MVKNNMEYTSDELRKVLGIPSGNCGIRTSDADKIKELCKLLEISNNTKQRYGISTRMIDQFNRDSTNNYQLTMSQKFNGNGNVKEWLDKNMTMNHNWSDSLHWKRQGPIL
ncbi:hypothetical protein Trydic_g13148 [Trypoxylus dichotomus]